MEVLTDGSTRWFWTGAEAERHGWSASSAWTRFPQVHRESTGHDSPGGYYEAVATGKRRIEPFTCSLFWDKNEATHAAVIAAFNSEAASTLSWSTRRRRDATFLAHERLGARQRQERPTGRLISTRRHGDDQLREQREEMAKKPVLKALSGASNGQHQAAAGNKLNLASARAAGLRRACRRRRGGVWGGHDGQRVPADGADHMLLGVWKRGQTARSR